MLTRADDFPVHQTPEPVAHAMSDRNFYDRYFFSVLAPDASQYVAVAFGMYPNLDVADAHVAVVRDGAETCLHASRHLASERLDLRVGPIAIEVLEPLRRVRVTVDDTDGIALDVTFDGRAFPIEEPRFIHRVGPKIWMDSTRLSQNVRCTGWVSVDGDRRELADGSVGTRDRSWGIRPVGAPEPQPLPVPPPPQFFWLWSPVNLADRSLYFHTNDDAEGRPWNRRSVVCPDGAAGPHEMTEVAMPRMDLVLRSGTRWAESATLTVEPSGGPAIRATYRPLYPFLMRGIGYSHPTWSHGTNHGVLAVEREDVRLADADPPKPHDTHIQAICEVTVEEEGRADETVVAVLEQLFIGDYAPLGLTGILDPAP